MIWLKYNKMAVETFPDSRYIESIQRIVKYISSTEMEKLPLGMHEIDGDNLYVNVIEYVTKNEEDCIWEAHKAYLDLHFIISGKEIIKINATSDMEYITYIEEQDYVKMEGSAYTSIEMKEGSIMLLYPEDAHKTAVKVQDYKKIKKAVFKILIK